MIFLSQLREILKKTLPLSINLQQFFCIKIDILVDRRRTFVQTKSI